VASIGNCDSVISCDDGRFIVRFSVHDCFFMKLSSTPFCCVWSSLVMRLRALIRWLMKSQFRHSRLQEAFHFCHQASLHWRMRSMLLLAPGGVDVDCIIVKIIGGVRKHFTKSACVGT
jgi:hypothetical protein